MTGLLYVFPFVSLLLARVIFGFLYAWLCSAMWGLDATDPLMAITATQSINFSVRNAVFAMAFFGTPMALLATAFIAFAVQRKSAALAITPAAVIYPGAAFVPTVLVNVPMNEARASVALSIVRGIAEKIWRDYSVAVLEHRQDRRLRRYNGAHRAGVAPVARANFLTPTGDHAFLLASGDKR